MLFLITVILAALTVDRATGIRCYVCTNIDKPEDCYHIGECSTGQQCHIKKYTNTVGFEVFDLGCQSNSFCSFVANGRREVNRLRQSEVVSWHKCCSDDYCNIDFDEHGNKSVHSGLRCLNCDYVKEPAECDTVITCEKGDACFTFEKNNNLGEHGFGMSCKQKEVCKMIPPSVNTDHHHSRSLELCQGCCDIHSHCNMYFCSTVFNASGIPAITPSVPYTTTPASFLNISSGPVDQAVQPGGSVVFDCKAYGYPTVNVTWLFSHTNKSTVQVITTGVNTTSNGSQLVINNVTESQLGHYICFATSNKDTAKVVAELMFTDYVNITKGPSSIDVAKGSTATFDCEFTGFPPPTVTWMFTHKDNTTVSVVTSGVNTTSHTSRLTISNVTDSDLGTYVCIANNSAGQIREIAYLGSKALDYVNITKGPSSINVTKGSTATFDCEFTGFPPPTVTWMFTHKDNATVSVVTSGVNTTSHTSRLTISNVTDSDPGTYVCIANNSAGQIREIAYLGSKALGGAPKIRKGPQSQNIALGDRAELPCQATGNPKPTIEWNITTMADRNDYHTATGLTFHLDKSVVIAHMTQELVGTYTCTATNSAGSDSVTATLTIS